MIQVVITLEIVSTMLVAFLFLLQVKHEVASGSIIYYQQVLQPIQMSFNVSYWFQDYGSYKSILKK